MNEHINPVVEIKRLDAEAKDLVSIVKLLADKINEYDVESKRLRFDLDEFKGNVKENKNDKAVSASLRRLNGDLEEIKSSIKYSHQEIEKIMMDFRKELEEVYQFLNEERFRPVFDRLKALEIEFKKKAVEIVTGSFNE